MTFFWFFLPSSFLGAFCFYTPLIKLCLVAEGKYRKKTGKRKSSFGIYFGFLKKEDSTQLSVVKRWHLSSWVLNLEILWTLGLKFSIVIFIFFLNIFSAFSKQTECYVYPLNLGIVNSFELFFLLPILSSVSWL